MPGNCRKPCFTCIIPAYSPYTKTYQRRVSSSVLTPDDGYCALLWEGLIFNSCSFIRRIWDLIAAPLSAGLTPATDPYHAALYTQPVHHFPFHRLQTRQFFGCTGRVSDTDKTSPSQMMSHDHTCKARTLKVVGADTFCCRA